MNSSNSLVRSCADLALFGSCSSLSNSVTHMSASTGRSRYEPIAMLRSLQEPEQVDVTLAQRSAFIGDILGLRHHTRTPGHITSSDDLDVSEIVFLLHYLCTDRD